jgi:hypothetical protein
MQLLTRYQAARVTIPAALPHDPIAERAIVGGILLDKRQASAALVLRSDDFYTEANRVLFGALCRLVAKGQPCDLITLRDQLFADGDLDRGGGVEYIASLIDGTARSANVGAYTEIVKRHARRRRIATRAEQLSRCAMNGETDEAVARLLDEFRRETAEDVDDGFRWERLDISEAISATPRPLDWIATGLCAKGEAVVLTAGTGLGKTYLTLQLAIDGAVGRPALGLYPVPRPLKVLWIDEEMGREMLSDRLTRQVAASHLDERELDLLRANLDIRHQQGLSLGDKEQFAIYDKTLREGGYDLNVMDSMVALTTGQENNADDVRAFYNRCIAPYKGKLGTAFWILAHPPKPHRDAPPGAQHHPRGSGDKINSIDRSFYLEFDSETITEDSFVLKVVLNRKKMRQGGSVTGQVIVIDGPEAQPVHVRSLGSLGGEKATKDLGKINTCVQDIVVKLRGAPDRKVYQPQLKKEMEDLGYDLRNHFYPARDHLVNQRLVEILDPIKGAPEGTGQWLKLTSKADE